jgi:hypothetical protein
LRQWARSILHRRKTLRPAPKTGIQAHRRHIYVAARIGQAKLEGGPASAKPGQSSTVDARCHFASMLASLKFKDKNEKGGFHVKPPFLFPPIVRTISP